MATYNAADLLTKPVPGIDNAACLFGTINNSVATATGDLLRPLKLPGGFRLGALLVKVTTAFGATAPASIGVSHTDGSTVPASVYGSQTAATAIAAAADTSHASTGTKVILPANAAMLTTKESYLEVLFGTIATGAAGVADYVALGEFVGTK